MRKLPPVVGILLAFALACGEGDDATETPVITVEPTQPDKPADPVKPAEPETKVVYETISETVSVDAERRGQIEALGRKEIVAKGKAMGYSSVSNINVGPPNCTAKTCTATVTGQIKKTVTVEAEAATGEAAPAQEPAAE